MYLKQTLVADEITNTDFSGEIKAFGDTVRVLKQPVITVGTYTRGTKIVVQPITDAETTMVIDQGRYVAFALEDIEQQQSHVDYQSLCEQSAGYEMKKNYDADILSTMLTGAAAANTIGSAGTPATVGFGSANDFTPAEVINRAERLLHQQNVPMGNRFFVADPTFFEALKREDSKLIEASVTGDSKSVLMDTNGFLGSTISGMRLYMSNNLPTNAGYINILFGHKDATSTAMTILKNEVIRSQDSFGDINRSLFVYGRKVFRSEAIGRAYITIGDVA